MKYNLCADIMFVRPGDHGPLWPDTEGIVEAMELAKKNDLDGIEMFGWEGRDLSKLAEKSAELGIEIFLICAKGGELWGNPGKFGEFVEGFKDSIPAAKRLDCRYVVLNANDYDRTISREEVHRSMVEGLKAVAPMAEQEGITILIEPVSGGYFRDSAEPFGMLDEVNSTAVKVLYDIFHYQLMEGNICQTIQANLDKIGHIHGAGAPMRNELTSGELDYSYILHFLKEIGYDGSFCMEFFTFDHREEKVEASSKLLKSIV